MNAVFAILSVQALIGAFDNVWHHELEAKLPQHISARYELVLHASREVIYAVLFLGLAWVRWEGAWAWVLAGLLAVEIVITLADFIEEDLTRRLPKLERVLHTILAVSYGAFVAALAPEMLRWATAPTGLPAVGHGWVSWLFTLYAAGVFAWSVRNWIAVARLYRAARTALPDIVVPAAHGPAVLVTGGTGFIGTALVRSLVDDGARVIVLTRDARRASATFGPRVLTLESLDAIPSETPVTAIVNLAGASVLGGRWTSRRKAVLLASRINTTRAIHALAERLETQPRVLVNASAVGFYGDRPDAAELDETAPPQPGQFQSDLCAAWEIEAKTLRLLSVRVVKLRFGAVLGCSGGMYPPLALVARLGVGAIFGTGKQAMPWVHLDDAVAALRLAIAQDSLEGAVNVVAPGLASQAMFARSVAGSHAFCPRVPTALITALSGEAATLLLGEQAATPRRLLAAGFRFAHPTLAGAVAALSALPVAHLERRPTVDRQQPDPAVLSARARSSSRRVRRSSRPTSASITSRKWSRSASDIACSQQFGCSTCGCEWRLELVRDPRCQRTDVGCSFVERVRHGHDRRGELGRLPVCRAAGAARPTRSDQLQPLLLDDPYRRQGHLLCLLQHRCECCTSRLRWHQSRVGRRRIGCWR
jgi:uncharacterized protein (TIGR01777 family)